MSTRAPLPSLLRALVRLLAPAGLRVEIEGDLAERFAEIAATRGRSAARAWAIRQVLLLVPMRAKLRERRVQASVRAAAGARLGGGWMADLKHALRVIRRRPAAGFTVILTVTLAVGATTAVYSVVDGVLLRPLPYPESDRLVRLWQTKGDWMDSPNAQLRDFALRFPLSMPVVGDWEGSNTGLSAIGAYDERSFVVQGDGTAEVLRGMAANPGYFDALGVEPVLGRRLTPSDNVQGAPPVAILSESLWLDRFGGAPDVLGSTLVLSGSPYTVIGVMPGDFRSPTGTPAVWVSFSDGQRAQGRDSQWLQAIGRLSDGVTMEMAAQRIAAVQASLAEAHPEDQGDVGSRVESLLDFTVGNVRTTLWFLFGAVVLVLVIATVNIANVLTVQGLVRQRELAVRAALGAERARLMRAQLVEAGFLAAVGGAAGMALAWLSMPVLLRFVPASVPRLDMVGIQPGVLLFGIAVTGVTALLVGVFPALLAARTRPLESVNRGGRSSTWGRGASRLRSGLVSLEVALAFVLLVAAGLLGKSYLRLWSVDRGFEEEGLVALRVPPDPEVYPSWEDRDRFTTELRRLLDEIPGVTSTATNQIPLSGSTSSTEYELERAQGEAERVSVMISAVLDNYLEFMEIPILAGRDFDVGDARDAAPVAIVSRTMADELWPGESPLGKRLRRDDQSPWIEVVGVAADVKHRSLSGEVDPKLYVPAAQSGRGTFARLIRVRGDLSAASELAREAVASLSPSTPVRQMFVLEEAIARSVAVPRFRAYFIIGLAGFAAGLALLGVYGVLSFSVAQRAKEIGVRMALGARADRVVRDVVTFGLKLAAVGIAAGLAVVWRLSPLVEDFLFQMSACDAATYVLIVAALLAVTAVSAYAPAMRAAKVDPVRVLNAE